MRLVGLTCPDGFVNPQYVATSVDTTGMEFTAEYSDGTTDVVSPQSYIPTTWGDTAGTQTCTFSYTEDEVTVTCEVEATVEPITVTSLSVVGTPMTQYYGQELNLTATSHHDLAFTYGLSNGESGTITDIDLVVETGCIEFTSTALDENYCWTAAGTQTITFTVNSESEYWAGLGYVVADPEPSTDVQFNVVAALDSLSVSGSFTNTQYTGSAPDLTGLTFTATYDDQSTKTVSASDIVCTPSVWDASGNPNNLGTQNVVFTYTEDGNSVSTGINGTVIHRPNNQTISASAGGHAYYDLTQELFNHATQDGMAGPMDILTGQKTPSTGDWVNLVFTQDEIDDPSLTVDGTKMQGWAQQVLIRPNQSSSSEALPNTPQFEPGFGFFTNGDLNSSYYAVALQGGAQLSEPVTLYSVFGTLKSTGIDPSVGYCLSDLNVADRTTYIVHITV